MKKKVIKSDKAPAPIGPYNQAIMVEDTLYVSGQIGLNAETGQMSDGSLEEETHQVMMNVGSILEEAGLGFSDVIKCSIFIADMKQFSRINEVYGSYFDGEYPVRETVEVANLPKFVQVEISCIAVK